MLAKQLICVSLFLSIRLLGFGQGEYPVIGERCPDFILNNISNYPKKQSSLKEFEGRFVILDFWNKYCVACIKSFPKTNAVYQQFKDKVDIILVGREEEGIVPLYDRLCSAQELDIIAAFDSTLYNRFVFAGAPLLMWIDDKGVVKAITIASDLTAENVEAFTNGEDFEFRDISYAAYTKQESNYDYNIPFLVGGNGGDDTQFLHRSLLAKYKPGMPFHALPSAMEYHNNGIIQGVADLTSFYRFAYSGKYTWSMRDSIYNEFYFPVVLELMDSSAFMPDYVTGENFYWYSLTVPNERAEDSYLKDVIQRDLETYFGYDVNVETRMMPYWKITASPAARKKLATRGGKRVYKFEHMGGEFKNVSMIDFLEAILFRIQRSDLPFIDETGIVGNIDIDVEVNTIDVMDIKEKLEMHGLSLIKGEKEYKVLVIRDPKPDNSSAQSN